MADTPNETEAAQEAKLKYRQQSDSSSHGIQ